MAVAAAVAVGTALFLQGIAARTVENHELTDLVDETYLRGWSLIDRLATYREEIGRLAADADVQEAAYRGDTQRLARRGEETCPDWAEFLAVEILDSDGEPVAAPVVNRVRGLDASEQIELIRIAEREPRNVPLLSRLVRSPVEIRQETVKDGEVTKAAWREQWMPVLWGCVRIQPPGGWAGEPRYLTVTLGLEPFYSSRHLFFLVDVDAPGQPFIMHPDMATALGFGRDDLFERDLRGAIGELRQTMAVNPEARMESVGLLKAERLQAPFYFQEGKPTEEFRAAMRARQERDPEGHDAYLAALTAHLRDSGWHFGGLSANVPDVRLLAADRAAFAKTEGGEPNFVQTLERELRRYTELPANRKPFRWKKLLECRHCHISCIDLHLAAGNEPRRYLILYAAFQEEFTGAIHYEIRSKLWSWALLLGAAGLGVAMLAAMSFVQPIRQMTATSQHILADEGALHERLAELASALPVDRKDEVGDIARASKRLFEEIISSQEQLEERVRARTAELEAANLQLEGLAREKDAFLANVSHELRTPLTAVSGFLQLLQRKLQRDQPLGDKEKDYVAKSLAAAAHLETLIDDILDFQKIIMGGITADPETFKLSDFLLDLRESLQFQARKNQNTLEFVCDHRLTELHTDRHRLRQILTNLISNACKFSRESVVRLEAKRFKQDKAHWVRFRVTDRGRGMTKEEQARLFTRFYTSKKMNQSGTGLGLVISEGLGRLLGGRVYLEHSAPGQGSTFAVDIPLHLDPPPPKLPAPDPDVPSAGA
jgi:signal transduction histidine kinase